MMLVALIAFCAIIVAIVALTRVNELDRVVVEQKLALRNLARQIAALADKEQPRVAASEVQERTRASDTVAAAAEVVKPAASPGPEPVPISGKPAAPQRPIAPPAPPVAPVPPAPPTAVERPSPPQAVPVLRSAVPPRPLPTPPGTPDPLSDSRPPAAAFDWEDLVGVKLFSWVAAIALALGVILFLRYSIQAGWLQPPIQMAIGIVVGLALLVGCELKVARNYPVTANALDASGVVILFSTFFAAFARWHLIPGGAAFLFLILVTAVAVLLSVRRDSLFIAVLGLIGGFLTPALLSTGQDNPLGLFGYLLILNAGLAWVAYRKQWALLTAVSLAMTTVYQWSWIAKFLTDEKLGLAAGIFLIFPVLGFVALALGRRNSDGGSPDLTFSLTANIGGILPLLFAGFMAAVPAYGAHTGLLFGFLVCIDAGLLAVSLANPARAMSASSAAAAKYGSPATWDGWSSDLLHLAGAFATNVIFFAYLAASYTSTAWPSILGFVALFVLFYLGAPLFARRIGRPFVGPARYASFGSGVLLFTFPVLIGLEPATASPALIFTVLFVLLAAISAFALFAAAEASRTVGRSDVRTLSNPASAGFGHGVGAIHFVGAFFALVAETVWSATFLTQPRLLAALIVYLVFALFYIGVPVLARRLGRPLQPHGAGVAILLVSLALLFFPAGLLASDTALWGLALLLAILNVAVFVEGVAIRWPVVSLASSAISWFVIATWWARASEGSLTGPGLLVVAAFTMLTIGGHIWNATRSDRTNAAVQNGVYLGLVGHLFLLFVAGQPALSIPPWPMLAVLLVLDLAIGAAALYLRQASLHLSAIVASALVILAWLSHAVDAPWPATAMVAAGVLAALAVVWMRLARATGTDSSPFLVRIDAGGALGFLLAQLVAMFASGVAATSGVGMLTVAHVAFAGGLLGVAAFRRWHLLAVLAVAPWAASLALWQSVHPDPSFWLSLLAFSGCVYAVFLAYPLALGRRARSFGEPYAAAVLASAVFFFAARHSLVAGGFGNVIGVLPVFQALLMAGLLWNLLRLEAPGARAIGRLALVAGAALSFITVAIPLQLDKEWITIGWALEGAALVWLYRRIPHRGLLLASTALLATVFVRLALNPAVFVYQPRGAYLLWNWYLYTYLVSAGALLLSARLFRGTEDVLAAGILPRARSLVAAGGTVLLFLLLNIEIADAYSTGPNITFDLGGSLAQGMTYTLGWGVFAVVLLVAGIVIHSRPARFAALALLVVTVLKGFLYDLSTLGGLYRVVSFVGLAICLALVAVVLQKFVLRPPERKAHESVR